MLIKGVNSAVHREGGMTVLDLKELLFCMTRSERIRLMKMIDSYNDDEARRKAGRPSRLEVMLRETERPRRRPWSGSAVTPWDKGA